MCLQAMLDVDGSSGITQAEFVAVAHDLLALEKRCAEQQAEEVRHTLTAFSKLLADSKVRYI